MKKFSKAIVKLPCRNMIYGLTESKEGMPDFDLAKLQHSNYIEALERCGLDVIVLPEDENYPDSVFIEDVSVLTPHCAIVTRPGATSRRDEINSMDKVLGEFYDSIDRINEPGTLDGGDVLMVGSHYYIGLSDRTNLEGANQFIEILNKYRMTGSTIELDTMLHLKSGVAYLENENLVVSGEFVDKSEFENFNKIIIQNDEQYAANCLWINGTVLIPEGYPNSKIAIESLGYKTITLDMSEFRKLDGGLSCLSLRF